MADTSITRHGPKPGLKKPRPTRQPTPLITRKLSTFPHLRTLKPTLSWVKLHHPSKGYRLVWEFMGRVVYCGENQIAYKSRGRVIEAGNQLSNLLGVKFKP